MNFPSKQWLKIVQYRDFFDFPRFFLASDGSSYWTLDGSFDDAKDDYADAFVIRFVGTDEIQAKKKFAEQAPNSKICSHDSIVIATRYFRFDKTKRAECFVDLMASAS